MDMLIYQCWDKSWTILVKEYGFCESREYKHRIDIVMSLLQILRDLPLASLKKTLATLNTLSTRSPQKKLCLFSEWAPITIKTCIWYDMVKLTTVWKYFALSENGFMIAVTRGIKKTTTKTRTPSIRVIKFLSHQKPNTITQINITTRHWIIKASVETAPETQYNVAIGKKHLT